MKIVISSDEYCELIETIRLECKNYGHSSVYIGPNQNQTGFDWPDITAKAANLVQTGEADEAIVLCFTGTGASIAANKMKGIRCALCVDAETARGARLWNHANVLALSIRLTTSTLVGEILRSWFTTQISNDEWNKRQIVTLDKLESAE